MPKLQAYADRLNLKEDALLNSLLGDIFKDEKPYFLNSDDEYKEFVSSIANLFKVEEKNVYIVGSGKIGFSIKSGLDFDERFRLTKQIKDKSDIDIAIISNDLFIDLMKKCWKLTAYYQDHTKWTGRDHQRHCLRCKHPTKEMVGEDVASLNGIVCEKHIQNNQQEDILGKLRNDKVSFFYYLAAGWFRRDLAPKELRLEFDDLIWDLRKKYNRKLSYAIYADFDFFKEYQSESLKKVLLKKGLYGRA